MKRESLETTHPQTGMRVRLAFAFTMTNAGEIVPCQISDAAMDDLAETKGTLSIARQAQFVAHRDAIERIPPNLFDKAPSSKGYVVRIFSKHIQAAAGVLIESIVQSIQCQVDS